MPDVILLGPWPAIDAPGLLAQAVSDPDILGQIQAGFQNFMQSGQVWAMVIGIVIGYGIRSLTS
ncbi:hypothetical protein VB712_02950 [Spirulina sp. CCNP1310]|uniref:hypothetical protein n=1 Tax=Spirulina sp. CCNP1310 TaxID=3110249 RepID=UPI002B2218BF|nr:hypothetical protein [Spirulina sp. CCNP1310]MEA5418166.1 hypothetical protein [Spirulina sp. CCNP1310]